jgi:hypothetical protein
MSTLHPERAVSLMSGRNVYDALQEAGFNPVFFDMTPENMSILDDSSIDVFFPILHGRFGEDGCLQRILEEKKLCFTGSGSESSRNSFDKLLSKQAFSLAPVACPAPGRSTRGYGERIGSQAQTTGVEIRRQAVKTGQQCRDNDYRRC